MAFEIRLRFFLYLCIRVVEEYYFCFVKTIKL
jgi:hypothetical protein